MAGDTPASPKLQDSVATSEKKLPPIDTSVPPDSGPNGGETDSTAGRNAYVKRTPSLLKSMPSFTLMSTATAPSL